MHKARLEDINKLFLEYRRLFEARDAEQIADFYRFPIHYYFSSGQKSELSRDYFVGRVNKLLKLYERLAVDQIVGAVTDVIELNENTSLATLNWVLLDTRGDKPRQIYSAITRYMVCEFDGELKIDGLIGVNETQQLKNALRAQ
ncbi:hypothetical protein [Microbulbifer hydrolyticus]|uniref:Nuclear transport factor 2 family protein n=1 Tax=Microbulbifer hydrolyticus TaxID=48074 RepID=A0A6P1TGG3_9GAMM|nr:hypothetical protein [Microbulbifer hydrolyticus]MBB5211786.1 hypothetical protein [Microbulbifer hydrolyticus]QHQ40620.1 hypothetical protein GTQ55_17630 [Microbulbifer hydrolyticus]